MTYFLQYVFIGLLTGGLYSAFAVTVVLVYKATHVASLAHGQILAFGAVFFYLCMAVLQLPTLVSFLAALALAGVLGFIIERLTMRPLIGEPLFTSFLMTFAVFMFLDGVFNLYVSGETRFIPPFLPQGNVGIGELIIAKQRASNFVMTLLPTLMVIGFFRYSKVGLRMRATAENHRLAQSAGIRVKNVFSIIWIFSSILAAVAGIGCATVMNIHYPLPYNGLKGLLVALVGGLDSIGGAILAGLLVGVIESLAAGYVDPLTDVGGTSEVVAYVLLLFILLVKPYGLFGLGRIERI